MTNLDQEIADLEKQLAEQKKRLESLLFEQKNRSPTENLAIAIHDATCHYNHTDQCDWHYSISDNGRHDWRGCAHERAMKDALRVRQAAPGIPVDTIIGIFNALGKR